MAERENLEAAREAREAIATRPSSSGTSAREAALGRYLGAQEYHELKAEKVEKATEGEHADDKG